jgi:Protein of unknown function (DUF3224)
MIRTVRAASRTRALAALLARTGMATRRWTPMPRRLLVALAIAGATLLPAVTHAQASPGVIPARGTFALVAPPEVLSSQTTDGTTFITQRVQYRLTGTLTGTGGGEEQITLLPNQTANLKAELAFTGTVDGRPGTLRIVLNGRGTGMTRGQFVLLNGTGDLAALGGQGAFEGSPETGTGTYTGAYQFGG